ncbi:MAG: flagellar basal body-associated FliL family protein [Paracoccaceae bacterium]
MKKLAPFLITLIGIMAGTGAGFFFKPAPSVPASDAGIPAKKGASTGMEATHGSTDHDLPSDGGLAKPPAPSGHASGTAPEAGSAHDYVRLNNQFVVPVVSGSKVTSLVVMSLSIEVEPGQQEEVFSREPRIRDSFLQVLFDHANAGGFDGAFTSGERMKDLRGSLLEAVTEILGPIASDVLVLDIVRQDV